MRGRACGLVACRICLINLIAAFAYGESGGGYFLLINRIACAGGAGLGSQVPGLVALRGVRGALRGFWLDFLPLRPR